MLSPRPLRRFPAKHVLVDPREHVESSEMQVFRSSAVVAGRPAGVRGRAGVLAEQCVSLSEVDGYCRHEGYTHGWLILLVCVALTIRARRELAAAPTQAAPLAQLALAGAIVAWLVCYRASIESLEARSCR